MKTIDELQQRNHAQSQEACQRKDAEEERIARLESLLSEEQAAKRDLLEKTAMLETQTNEQRDLLHKKDSQLDEKTGKIKEQEAKLREMQDAIGTLEKKNTQVESMLIRMEAVVKKSNHLQEQYLGEMTKLKVQTQEQSALLDEKEEQLKDETLKVKYLSDLCCQAKEAMHEDKTTIARLESTLQDLETTMSEQQEDLKECKESLFSANQIIALTEQRDSYLKPYVRTLAGYYQDKEEHRGCFFQMFAKRRQSPAFTIVSKLAKVFLSEEDN